MKNQNRLYSYAMPAEDHTKSPYIRHMTPIEYIELYDHVQHSKPVYIFNTKFVIRDYRLASITTSKNSEFSDIMITLTFFRPYINLVELEELYPYITDYNSKDQHRGHFEVYDMTIPLHYLCIKPFNSKAGSLFYGNKGT